MALTNNDLKKQAVVTVTAPNGDVKRVAIPHELAVGRVGHTVPFTVYGSGVMTHGLSASLTRLPNGTSYLVAGQNVTITSSSNGQVVLAVPSAGGAPTDATYVTITPNATLSAERVLSAGANITITTSSTGVTISSTAAGGGGADDAAQYVVMTATSSLANERVLTAGLGLTRTDAGAGGAVTLAVNNSVVATVSGSTFTQVSGSLQKLASGVSYLVGGQNVSVNTSSAGQVLVAGPLGWVGQTDVQSIVATGGWETIGGFYVSRVPDQVTMEAIVLVSSSSLSGSVRLFDVLDGGAVTGSFLGTNATADRRLVTANIAGSMTANRLYQVQAECFGGADIEHFLIVRNVIVA